MTFKEFSGLKKGDKVKLPFSTNENHLVISIDLDKQTISSHPTDDSTLTCINKYEDIEFVPMVDEIRLKEKEHILDMFHEFRLDGCNKCPFYIECENTYSETRAHSTSPITICNALRKTEVDYQIKTNSMSENIINQIKAHARERVIDFICDALFDGGDGGLFKCPEYIECALNELHLGLFDWDIKELNWKSLNDSDKQNIEKIITDYITENYNDIHGEAEEDYSNRY